MVFCKENKFGSSDQWNMTKYLSWIRAQRYILQNLTIQGKNTGIMAKLPSTGWTGNSELNKPDAHHAWGSILFGHLHTSTWWQEV